MPTVAEAVSVATSLGEAWELYFDSRRWPSWVDGFARVEASDGYPEPGGTLRWSSTAAGRGTVVERVVEHEVRRRHRIEFSDPESEGELLTSFAIESESGGVQRTRVRQEMTYRVRGAGPLTRLTDRIFIRPQVARSLRRSLERFGVEAEEASRRE